MTQVIGFATSFYTLWDMRVEENYITDVYGNHHRTNDTVHYGYIKNISTDLEKVKALYPTLTIDENVRGKIRSFEYTNKEQDLCPHILKFGKYYGHDINDLAKTDFNYLIWLAENAHSFAVREIIKSLPEYVAYLTAKQQADQAKLNGWQLIRDGLNILTFLNNPNYIGENLDAISSRSRVERPITNPVLQWEQETDKYANRWNATGYNGNLHTVTKFHDHNKYECNSIGFDTLEEAQLCGERADRHMRNHFGKEKIYEDTGFTPYLYMNYAKVELEPDNMLYVFFPETNFVNGLYPYTTAYINGKYRKTKNQTFTLNLKVFLVEKSEHSCTQFSVVI